MNNNLITLLESIIENIKNDKYTSTHLNYLSSFLCKFSFFTKENQNPPSNRDLINFLSLGWYVYNNLETTN